MKLSEFNYYLPKNLIAQYPKSPRDHSRLLVLNRKNNKILHKRFFEIDKFLKKGDIIVLNNSKVIPARLFGKKKTGGKAEVLLLKRIENTRKNVWECLVKMRNPKILTEILFNRDLKGKIIKSKKEGIFWVKFNKSNKEFQRILSKIGETPLPPYIESKKQASPRLVRLGRKSKKTRKQYQTIYADSKKEGSVAAPTAGFHFTKRLIKRLKEKGIKFEFITLYVGLGTFKPVKTDKIERHKMHPEYAEMNKKVIQRLIKAKKEEKKIIACGTTSIRALETILPKYLNEHSKIKSFSGDINAFIYPGYKFKIADGIITNFHLPKTTLLMLVAALISENKKEGIKLLKKAYFEAIKRKYRFYSFGDAMLIY